MYERAVESWATFLVTVLVLLATPGPTNTLLATAGASLGVRASLRLIPFELTGYLVSIVVWSTVLRPLMRTAPWVQVALQLACGVFLVVLAIRLWRRADTTVPRGPVSGRQVLVTTLLNPKAAIFALVVIPHLSTETPMRAAPYLAAFGGLVCVAASGWVTLGSSLHRGQSPLVSTRTVNRVAATALVVFATVLCGSGVGKV